MKLARPDVFHPRIVLAGCPERVAGDDDDEGLVAALRQRGLHARWLSWDHPDVGRAHLVILRATHDYPGRLDEFLAWTATVQNLLNPPAVVAWNVDRRYLRDLQARGVPTVPGHAYPPGARARLPRRGAVFIGPTIGTGVRRGRDRSAAAGYIAELHAGGRSVFVQPADAASETVLVFLGGEPSHAFTVQQDSLRQVEPDFEAWDVGAGAVAAAAAQVGVDAEELLYARAHVVADGSGNPRLLELQLVDPSLGWRRLDADTRDLAQRRFAVRVQSALERLGLGPFSHRRP
ncbi:hypothetical protein H7H78_20250 [Mycobacterium shinjukuense]|uniref:Uncharacterized protein n=1 Tax=Mycobacterium shinjukuense TaxID=398694 RepID=A0A7I7MRG9_9MYCO|nr:hypothetical protein [Mycobacterium shinjukuense]MCV6987659.1 hypothetical protein [Mycobacterium shinjukuense]ORB67377.1 hypothetical protein BST45_12695 [Mycobacterium shinjukuense]BBX73849.1 hypothetical protein MSHI_17550 [Mycobacterium shinjukuense]